MKAVVLARGKGTRMRQASPDGTSDPAQSRVAESGVKGMIPFRRPFLDYVLSALADAGCREVCLVIGPEHGMIREYYERTRVPERVRVTFAIQQEARGTADAVLSARAFTGDTPFLVLNADNYYPADVLHALVMLDGPGLPAFSRSALIERSNIDPDRIRSYALLEIAENGDLIDIVEKPDAATFARFGVDAEGRVARVSMNCWRFGPSIFDACSQVEPSARGEVELPNAVRYAIRVAGERFRTIPVEAGVLDLSRREDIAEVERRLAHVDPRP
jgi:glucose-1-phosphate thymidylyltransferase